MFDGASVEDGATANCDAYGVRRNGVWVVFPKIDHDPWVLRSSSVVVVCKCTGKVLFSGSAQDEG
jgi:hypothetical protein